MHGYGDVFTDEELERNAVVNDAIKGWREEVEQLDAQWAVVDAGGDLEYALRGTGEWDVVEEDEDFVLMRPSGASS